jgi:hypothetical protein
MELVNHFMEDNNSFKDVPSRLTGLAVVVGGILLLSSIKSS